MFFFVLLSFLTDSAENAFNGESELFALLRDDKTQNNSGLETLLFMQI